MKELTITVQIADRPYRLKINIEEEETVRKAAKLINEKIREYSNDYAFSDRQDLLSMVVLHFVSTGLRMEQKSGEEANAIASKLRVLNTLVSEQLEEN